MSISEDSHEVKAIQQRLVAAKLQTTSALKTLEKAKETKKSVKEMFDKILETLETATKSVDAAQNQYDMLQKDLKDTEKLLVEARERSSSNDMDQKPAATNDTNESSSSNKRRKVSVSPQTKTDNQITSDITSSCSSNSSSTDSSEESGHANSDSSSSDECSSVSSSIDEEKAIPTFLCDNGNNDIGETDGENGSNINQIDSLVATNWTTTNSNVLTSLVCRPNFKQVTIKDCGLSEFNGIYMLTEYNGQSFYRKRGQSGEKAHEIYLINTSSKRAWVMYRSGDNERMPLKSRKTIVI